jgi:hypothetical protein
MKVRTAAEVPAAVRGTRAAREAQQEYEGFIRAINSDVGELQLSAGEKPRGVKVRLRRAASRLGREIDTWEADGRVLLPPGYQTRPSKEERQLARWL